MKFYFTFGYSQTDANGHPLDDHYTMIEANDWGEARKKMVDIWGTVWAFQYDEEAWKESESNAIKQGWPKISQTYVPCPKSKLREE